MKDTDIQENVELGEIDGMLRRMAEAYGGESPRVVVEGNCAAYRGKPLALKRCLGNLVVNAVKYVDSATISV